MSVYKRPGAKTYSYDFEVGGTRFSGDTGATGRREAEQVQSLRRAEAKAARAQQDVAGREMPLGVAAARYMAEIGVFHRNSMTTLACLEWVEAAIGKTTLLSRIDDDVVSRMVARRRNEFRRVGNAETPRRLVSAATVNRTAIEPLRKVMLRAARIWKARVGDVQWSQHVLAEPRERVREASIDEEARLLAEIGAGYADAVRFMFLNGLRSMEVIGLRWATVDFFGRQFTVLGKGDKLRTIPMSQASFDLLWSLRGHHDDFVFTYAAKRTDPRKQLVRGKRYPLTDSGLSMAFRRAAKRAGVENLHRHDTRHTAATRTLRASNLKVVQNLLGHERITTTEKYAHALNEDIRLALEAASDATTSAKVRRADMEKQVDGLSAKRK